MNKIYDEEYGIFEVINNDIKINGFKLGMNQPIDEKILKNVMTVIRSVYVNGKSKQRNIVIRALGIDGGLNFLNSMDDEVKKVKI